MVVEVRWMVNAVGHKCSVATGTLSWYCP